MRGALVLSVGLAALVALVAIAGEAEAQQESLTLTPPEAAVEAPAGGTTNVDVTALWTSSVAGPLGSTQTTTMTLTAGDGAPEGWNVPDVSAQLTSGTEAPVTVAITLPATAAAGTQSLTLTGSTDPNGGAPTDNGVSSDVSLSLNIPLVVQALDVSTGDIVEVDDGHEVPVTLTLTANGPVDVAVSTDAEGVTVSPSTITGITEPGTTTLDQVITITGAEGPTSITFTPTSGGAPVEGFSPQSTTVQATVSSLPIVPIILLVVVLIIIGVAVKFFLGRKKDDEDEDDEDLDDFDDDEIEPDLIPDEDMADAIEEAEDDDLYDDEDDDLVDEDDIDEDLVADEDVSKALGETDEPGPDELDDEVELEVDEDDEAAFGPDDDVEDDAEEDLDDDDLDEDEDDESRHQA